MCTNLGLSTEVGKTPQNASSAHRNSQVIHFKTKGFPRKQTRNVDCVGITTKNLDS